MGREKLDPYFRMRLNVSTRKVNILNFRNGSILEPEKKSMSKFI